MRFRNKILLAIWSVVLGLLIITYIIINYWMRSQVEARAAEELSRGSTTILELSALRDEEAAKSCQIIAETPRLKAVVELGDRNTALQLSRELTQNTFCDLFILTGVQRIPLVELIRGESRAAALTDFSPIEDAIGKKPTTSVWSFANAVYRCATAPLMVGPDVIGTVTIGFTIDEDDINSVRSMTNCDVVLLLGSSLLARTSTDDGSHELEGWIHASIKNSDEASASSGILRIQTSSGLYEAIRCRLDRGGSVNRPPISLLLLKAIDKEVRAALQPVVQSFIVLSIIFLLVTAIIGFLISRGITRPIAALVQGTAEVSRGNYDYKIDVGTGEELKFLAKKFEEMSGSLKEKVRQLAEQNTELEFTLGRLKETQEELVKSERLAATGKLTAQLSHEINNPVHNIQSCLQTVLKKMDASSADRVLLDVAYEEVERLARLTQQLLQVYRSSIVQEMVVPVSVNEVISEVLTASQQTLQDGSLNVTANYAMPLPSIQGSPDKLKQVFLNLFLNAKDAMPRGGTLTIETSGANGSVVVHVTDSGVGIAPENINRIYDAFYTTKSKVSGVGLGLSVTYGIVKQHQGTISVRSRVGEGTTFTLVFPITP